MKPFPYLTPHPLQPWSPPLEDSGTEKRPVDRKVMVRGPGVAWKGLGAGVGLGLGGCLGEGQAVGWKSGLRGGPH